MPLHWPLLALLVSVVAWVLPLVIGGPGRGGGTGGEFPVWMIASYIVAAIALVAFIVLLVMAISFRRRP